MKEVSIDKQRDAVFFFIKDKTALTAEVNDKYIWNLYINRTPELQINQLLFQDILKYLVQEKLITKSIEDTYHVTIQGRMFKGYENQNKFVKRFFSKGVKEGIIYSLIVAVILTLTSIIYHFLKK
jgi:hypothetical protein